MDDAQKKTEYKEAETFLKDYLSGKLRADIERRKLEIMYPPKPSSKADLRKLGAEAKVQITPRSDRMEREVISYLDDEIYNRLQSKLKIIEQYLEYLKETEKTTHRIIMLFDYHKLQWLNVSNAVNLSESACQRRRKKAIKELRDWL